MKKLDFYYIDLKYIRDLSNSSSKEGKDEQAIEEGLYDTLST